MSLNLKRECSLSHLQSWGQRHCSFTTCLLLIVEKNLGSLWTQPSRLSVRFETSPSVKVSHRRTRWKHRIFYNPGIVLLRKFTLKAVWRPPPTHTWLYYLFPKTLTTEFSSWWISTQNTGSRVVQEYFFSTLSRRPSSSPSFHYF